jgi:hypothetical protein
MGFYHAHMPSNNPSHTCANAMLPMSKAETFCSGVYFSLATHVFTASSTALDRSPFFPPNLSMVLNLSSLSNSSGSSALILPIYQPQLISINLFARYTLDVFPISKLPDVECCSCLLRCHHFPSTFAYSRNMICAYLLIKVWA